MVEKALTTEEAENKIWRENAARLDVRRAMPPYTRFGRGGGPSDQKRKTIDTLTTAGPDRRGRGDQGGRQGGSESWRSYPECIRCRKRHLGECRAKACYLCGGGWTPQERLPDIEEGGTREGG